MKEFGKMAGVLMLLGALCAFILAFVNTTTFENISKAADGERDIAIAAVLPECDNEPSKDKIEVLSDDPNCSDCKTEIYRGRKNGAIVGFALISVDHRGYGGDVQVMVGVTSDGKVNKAKVIQHKETPGLGSKSEKPKFIDQLQNKSSGELAVKKDGGTVDAISGATITSRAVTNAARNALLLVEKHKNELMR